MNFAIVASFLYNAMMVFYSNILIDFKDMAKYINSDDPDNLKNYRKTTFLFLCIFIMLIGMFVVEIVALFYVYSMSKFCFACLVIIIVIGSIFYKVCLNLTDKDERRRSIVFRLLKAISYGTLVITFLKLG